MDNRVFRVNGSGSDMLLRALELVFMQDGGRYLGRNEGYDYNICTGWKQTQEHGLILVRWAGDRDEVNQLPGDGMGPAQVLPWVEVWLEGDFAKAVEPEEWCHNLDHDGSNSDGWIVYCEDWGKVGGLSGAICGIKRAYLWHGK